MSRRVKKSVSILPGLWKEAEERAERDDCSTSRIVERALRLALANPPEEAAPRRRRVSSQVI